MVLPWSHKPSCVGSTPTLATNLIYGRIVQRLERNPDKVEVSGSNPDMPTISRFLLDEPERAAL